MLGVHSAIKIRYFEIVLNVFCYLGCACIVDPSVVNEVIISCVLSVISLILYEAI